PGAPADPGAPVLKGDAPPLSAAPEAAEPPWRRPRQREAFAGDAATAARRNRQALAPDRLPEPPPSTGPKYVWVARLAGVVVVTAVGIVGSQWGPAPPASSPQLAPRPSQSGQPESAARPANPGRDSRSAVGRPAADALSPNLTIDSARAAS